MKKYSDKIPYIILILSAAALIIRAFYGFCWSDETFYISTTKRLFEGDLIFVDEWFPTQLSSLILLPFYAAFFLVTGSTSGIILYFRLVYILVCLLISCMSFMLLKRRHSVASALAFSLFIMFYAHLNIATMSYYTMSFLFFIFAMLLISEDNKRFRFAGGFLFALSVLSLPSLAIGFFAAAALILLFAVRFRSLRFPFVQVLAGIAFAAILFVIYLYASGNSLPSLFRFLPYVLSDEEHQTGLTAPFKKFFTSVTDVYGPAFCLSILLSCLSFLALKRDYLRKYFLAADIMLFIYYLVISAGHTGYINTGFALFALPVFCMTKKKDICSFLTLYCGGLAVSMTYSYSSNGELYVMAIGHGIACAAAILFIDDFIKEYPSAAVRLLQAAVAVFILQTCLLRFVNVYRDAPLDKLDTYISEGPAAGLYTTSEHALQYDSLYSDIMKNTSGNGYVFFSKLLPWGYLAADMKCGAPTTWRTKMDSVRLRQYFSEHPERLPDTVFVMKSEAGAYDSCGDTEADPVPNENARGGWFDSFLEKNDYIIKESDLCTIYQRQ